MMFDDNLNTIDLGEKPPYSSASGYWQGTETKSRMMPPAREGQHLFQPYLAEPVISTDISLPVSDSAGTATFFEVEESITALRLSYRHPEVVKAYLNRYPEIEEFIKSAEPALIECFGSPVDIVLEVLTYPDESTHQEVVGWIQSTDEIDKGLEKLEKFEDVWFLDHMDEVGDKFNFNIETK